MPTQILNYCHPLKINLVIDKFIKRGRFDVMIKVLVACEFSGTVRDAFNQEEGVAAYSCDLLPDENNSRFHFQEDALKILNSDDWDLVIAHPPCTRLANSGVSWLHRRNLWGEMKESSFFFKSFLDCPATYVCVENPVMHKYALEIIGQKHSQTIQPYQFGHDASKRTCLWLKNLPLLQPTKIIEPNSNGRYANQTPSGQNNLPPSKDRWKLRSKTYEGIAKAMAVQWTNFIKNQPKRVTQ